MLLNLGLTADAAAAHESDLVRPQSPSQLPSYPSARASSPLPLTALSSLPGLGTIYNKYKGMESPATQMQATQGATLRDMTRSPVESVLSSDGEQSVVDTGFRASPRVGRSQSVRKSLRPKTAYQLAHPASHAHHRCFKIRPKLLLQLQQMSHTPRPLPIFDVLPSTVFLPRLARKFPTIFRGKNGLGPNDLIIVTSDLYEQTGRRSGPQDDDSDDDEQQVVATICQLLNEEDLSKGKAEICLNRGPAWEATPLPNGAYEFVARTAQGVQTLRWVPRGSKSRRVSAPPGSPVQPESKRFTFSVINPNTRRHPVIASMTRNYLEIFDQYSMPTASPSSLPTSAMSMISDGSDETPLDRNVIAVDDGLRLLIIITSIWVAFREGWSHNFSYNDSALVLNTKISSPTTSRHASPTTIKNASDYFSVDKESQPTESQPRKHRVSMSNVPLSSDRLKSLASARLAKRSNSTGAAFIERSNRRSASGSKRPQRHSFLSANDLSRDGVTGLDTIPSESITNGNGQAQNGNSTEGTVKFASPSPPSENPRRKASQRVPHPEASTSRGLDGQTSEASPPAPKSKRRHRISGFFDCIFRRNH